MAARLHQTVAQAAIPSGEEIQAPSQAKVGETEVDQSGHDSSVGRYNW